VDIPLSLIKSEKQPSFIKENWHLINAAQKKYWPGLDN
jgi:hypothetical protein